MGRHSKPEDAHGGLHGTWLKALGAVSLVVVVVAVWMLTASARDDDAPPTGGGVEETSTQTSGGPDTTSVDSSPVASERPSPSPSPSPEPSTAEPPEETTEAEPPSGRSDCSATLRLDNAWEGNIEVAVTVTATGGTIDGWQVVLDLGDAEVYRYWNMSHDRGVKYRNQDWNGRLAPGDEAAAGFQAEVGADYELPDSVPCKTVT